MVEWKEVNPDVWDYEKEGDSITGVLVNKEKSEYGGKYYLKTEEDKLVLVWGTTILDDRLSMIEPGTLIKIQYCGEDKNKKGQRLKLFKVYTRTTERAVEEVVKD